jgi:hypothetical protein
MWICRDVLDSKMPLNPGVSHTWERSLCQMADNQAQYIALVKEAVSEDVDWEGIGILVAGGPQHVPAAYCLVALS